MDLSEIISGFFGKVGDNLPPWAILLGLGIIALAFLVYKRITRPTPTVSISNSNVRDVAGRDLKK